MTLGSPGTGFSSFSRQLLYFRGVVPIALSSRDFHLKRMLNIIRLSLEEARVDNSLLKRAFLGFPVGFRVVFSGQLWGRFAIISLDGQCEADGPAGQSVVMAELEE